MCPPSGHGVAAVALCTSFQRGGPGRRRQGRISRGLIWARRLQHGPPDDVGEKRGEVRKAVSRDDAMLGGAAEGLVPDDSRELWEGFRQAGLLVSYVLRRDPHTHIHLLTGQNLNLKDGGCCFRVMKQCWGRLWLQPQHHNTLAPCVRRVPAGMPPPPPYPPKGHVTSFPPGRDFLSLLVNEDVSCHPRCCLSPKVLANKGS